MSESVPFLPCDGFQRCFPDQPFRVEHTLAQHELLSLPALLRLARKAGNASAGRKGMVREENPPGFLVVNGQSIRWGTPEFHRTLEEAFEDLEHSNLRLKLSTVNQYDGYRDLLAQCRDALSELTGVDFSRDMNGGIATIFVASPHETTPYHIDEEVNFLLQIHGTKEVKLFDGNDRAIVPQRALEDFWFGHSFIAQVPGSSYQTFHLAPGVGVYQPPFFPHLITSGAQPSVSLSLPFQRRKFPEAEVHRMNAYLRRYGWKPNPPGVHPAVDELKSRFIRNALTVKRAVRKMTA